ncbi:hypothetical protein ACIRVF_08240 [Kitasatospora sp. NPDC101157]|uniref:hypothetical protein n=1 Tax=Kitasatospora sp. NPDC101157 TaxID=3364098 RepID=UPI0037F66533
MHTTPTDIDPDAPRCTHCPRLLRHDELDRHACRICEDRATTQLRALPGLYDQLGDKLTPAASASNTGRITGASGTAPLPVALTPLDLRGPGGIVSSLLGIEQRWRIHLDWEPLPFRGDYEHSLAGCVTMLTNNLPWACENYADIAAELKLINALHSRAESTVTGQWEQRVPIGCCPAGADDGGLPCGERLKVSPWALEIKCGGCGTTWPRTSWLALGATMRGSDTPPIRSAA